LETQLSTYISRALYDIPCDGLDVLFVYSTSRSPSQVRSLCYFTRPACLGLRLRLPLQSSARASISVMDIVLSVPCLVRTLIYHLHFFACMTGMPHQREHDSTDCTTLQWLRKGVYASIVVRCAACHTLAWNGAEARPCG
jgi:hypothetical protein